MRGCAGLRVHVLCMRHLRGLQGPQVVPQLHKRLGGHRADDGLILVLIGLTHIVPADEDRDDREV